MSVFRINPGTACAKVKDTYIMRDYEKYDYI